MPVLLRILVRICSRMLLLCRFCSGFSGFLISLPEQGMNLRSSSKDLSCRGRVILSSRSYCKCHLIQPPPKATVLMRFLLFSFGPPSEVPKCQCWAVVGYGGVALGVAGIEVHAVNVARILPRIVPESCLLQNPS